MSREPGLGEQRDHRLGEMPLPVQPAQPLIGAKRQLDGPGPSHSVDSPTAAPPLKKVRVSEIEIQTSETIETLEKKEKDQSELCAKLQEYRAIARERDEWKKKYEDLQVAYKEDEIKHLKELYMAKVSQVSPEVLASIRSSEGSNDTRPGTIAQELCVSREPEAPQQTRLSASNQRFTIPDPSDTYLAPQFQESFNQMARATMEEINRTTGRTLGRIVPSQRRDQTSNSSERAPHTIVPSGTAHGRTYQKSRVVDIRKNLMTRHQFTQVAAEHPRACLNDMSWNPATSDQVIPPGSRHLIIGDSLVRDLNEIFVYGQTTTLSFGGASVAQVIKMMEFQSEDHLDTLVIMLGTNDVSRAPVTPECKWEPLLVCLLNELKEKYRPRFVVLCTIPQNPLMGTTVADFMNGNVTRWNEKIRNLVRNNPGELRLLDLENTLRMIDHVALTKDGIHFNTQRGRHWMNDVFQTQLREMEQESRATSSLARTSSTTGGSRIRASVPESLVNRLGPLAMETVVAAPTAPSSNVRERLGTAPPPRTQPLESRLGRSVVQNRNNSQTVSRRNDPPATANPAPAAGPSTSAVPAEGVEPGSLLLWNRSDPSHWGQYKTDMSTKLNMNTLTCREDAMRMIGGESPTVSRLYRIPGVDWLLAEQEQFSSTTTLRHADLNGLPQDNTFGPLNTRSLTDVRQRARELTPPARRGKFQADNKPNNKHHKMYRQFAKPPGQTPGEYSRDYPRTTMVDGDDQRYGKLKAPIGDGLFAAYDPLEMKAAKSLIVASSDYLYTPRSLFWPDVIFLTAPKLDWGQAIGMMISVRRVVSMEPQVIVVAGSNDHLQSWGLLSRLTDGSIPSNEVIGEAIMTLLSAMAEVEAAARQRFTMNVVKVIFVLSPGYAALPEPLQFVYTMVTTIAEGRFNVIIPAPNRVVDPDNYYPSRSELPAVWADIPEEEWERYQSELEGKTGTTWSRVNFMERSWDVIRRYGTKSIMKVGLNQPIMREVLEKIVNSMESDVLTESVTEDSADDQQVAKKLPVRRARKGLKRLKGKTGSRAMNPRVVKSRASAVVTSLTSAGRSGESGQGDTATLTGGEKENLIPPMLLAGLTTTAVRSKKTARTLADTKLEMEIISQCGSGGLEDYRPSRTNIAKLKLEGQLDVVEYSRVTVPESVHMGDPAGGYVEMLKARNSARGHLMAWSEKRAMQEYLKELTENSSLNRKEYGTVMSSEANEIGLEKLLEISWRAALQRYFDEAMHAPATVAAYLAHPCVRTDLQVRLTWCLMGLKRAEYEASNDSKSREQELELMEALRALISKDDSAIAWAKRKDALCFVRFVVELYQDMPLTVPNKESNDMESYRKLEEVRRYSNKELKVSRELIEAVKGQKEFAPLGKLKSFQYVSGIPGMAYNPFVNEEAREAYFDYEQVIVLNFWVERIKETGMLMVKQPKLGIILEERVVEPSVPELKGQVSFDCGSWDGPLKTSLVTMWELMKPSWCPHPNAGLIWDMTADITLDLDDDASLHDLAMIHHLLAMRLTKRKINPSTELSEEGPSSNWLKQGTCLAQHSGMEGHVCNLGHCLVTLSEQHRQLARLYGRLSMSDKSGMELVADCHGVTDVNLITALGFCSMTSSIESLERLERAHELVTSLSVEVFPGALQTEQKIGGWREALENEMNLKDSEAYHKPTGSKYLVGSSSVPYCSIRYPTHMVVMDARTQQVLIDQLFSVPKCVRLARMSERSYDLLAKIFRAVPKISEGELQDVVGEEFLRLNEGNVSEFQKQKASGVLPTEFPTIEEKDDLHRILMEVEPLLGASGYRTRRNIVRTHGEYPCHCLAQTLWYPKRGNLMLVWDVEELYSTGLPDQNKQVSIVVVSAMLAVRWLEANADTSEQETAVPTPEQLSNVRMSRELDLFRTTCKVLRIPKVIERIWSRQGLMPWFRAVMTSWMYERAKRHMSRNTEAYQSFQLDIGPGAYKRAFLTYRNAVTTAVKRVAGAPCVTEVEKKEVLRADLERNVSLCLHNSFCRNREQKVNVDLLPCCKPRLLEQESWGTARNSMDMLEKVLEDSDAEQQDGEAME